MNKNTAIAFVDTKKDEILDISHSIWEYAELSLKEYKSAALYEEMLRKEGFEVETGLCGIDTAFSGKFGSGRPYIGILAEFDALGGLSQKANMVEKEELIPGGNGHGCGHNMLGAASFGAALGVKKYLEETGVSGTVFFYGCPGEEGGASKALMAREGVWKNLDAAITWHPGDTNEVTTGTCNSCVQVIYKFHGTSSHAAGAPELGRSALDAAEIMNNGVQYLREHMKSDARIHYAFLSTGGKSPNVVQNYTDVLYMIRSKRVKDVLELEKRVDKVALGASIMTETTYEKVFVDGCSNTVPNSTIERVLFDNMEQIPLPEYTEEEWKFAQTLKGSFIDRGVLPGTGAQSDKEIAKIVAEKSENGKRAFNDFIMPYYTGEDFEAGSTDVGDVSWLTPTAQMNAVCWPSGCPGHSWQNVSCGNSSIGDKGVMYAAKVLCGSAIDLLTKPEVLEKAKAEHAERAAGGYDCPVPAGAKLLVIED